MAMITVSWLQYHGMWPVVGGKESVVDTFIGFEMQTL